MQGALSEIFEWGENISVLPERLPTTATLECNKGFVCIFILFAFNCNGSGRFPRLLRCQLAG